MGGEENLLEHLVSANRGCVFGYAVIPRFGKNPGDRIVRLS